MKWFRHDTDAFKDERIQALRIDCGGAAVDAFYTILELIYECETDLVLDKNQAETKSVLHWLCLGWAGFSNYVETMAKLGLLDVETHKTDGEITGFKVMSKRAGEAIKDCQKKAEIARENGKMGGRPKKASPKKKTQKKPTGLSVGTQQKPDYKTIDSIEKDVPKGTSKKTFAKPSVEEIAAYATDAGSPDFNAAKFIDYYDSNGWKVGRSPMKDWRAAVRNWIRRDGESKRGQMTLREVADERYAEYTR